MLPCPVPIRVPNAMGSMQNLLTLHGEEEKLRERSLVVINQRAELRDHLAMIAEAMDVIWAFSHDHTRENDDELTMQLFGIRLFNAAAASIKLALSGYYQKSVDQVRDVIETGSLVDYLTSHPSEIAAWRAADKKVRKNCFGPDPIRRALDKRDGYTGEKRKKIYDLTSEAASHASFKGFALLANTDTNLGEIGPFFDETKLIAWLQELVKHLAAFAIILVPTQSNDLRLLGAQAHYLHALQGWTSKYLPGALKITP